jgi:hypothetical protein
MNFVSSGIQDLPHPSARTQWPRHLHLPWCIQICGRLEERFEGWARNHEIRTQLIDDWKAGKMDREGAEIGSDGYRYVGSWKLGLKDGLGTCTFKNGTRYEGNWKADEGDVHGICSYTNGTLYKGNWKADERDVHGICSYTNGALYKGN